MPKVILVDDEIWGLRSLEALLRDYPHYQIAATFLDGREALEYLRKNECDVVFTDLRMGRMGGRKLIAACREEGIDALMVIISAYSDFAAAREGIQSGVVDYLLKPVRREDVAALVGRLDACLMRRTEKQPYAAQRSEVALAYGECRVLCYRASDARAEKAIAGIDQESCALRYDNMHDHGFSLALLSNPANRMPASVSALPAAVGISRPSKDFSAFEDMCAQAQLSSVCAFRFSPNDSIADIQSYLLAHYEQPLTLDALSAHFFMNKAYLCSRFREECSMTVMTFLKRIRVCIAARDLLETRKSVQEIAARVGYPDNAYFSRVFKSVYHLSPEAYRRQQAAYPPPM